MPLQSFLVLSTLRSLKREAFEVYVGFKQEFTISKGSLLRLGYYVDWLGSVCLWILFYGLVRISSDGLTRVLVVVPQ